MLYGTLALVAGALITWAFVSGYRSYRPPGSTPASTPKRTKCSVCGNPSIEVDEQYCSYACRDRLAKSMDDWDDQFEQHFPDRDDNK